MKKADSITAGLITRQVGRKVLKVGSIALLTICATSAQGATNLSTPISDFAKRSSVFCTYEGVSAVCNQLLVTMYRKEGRWLFMKELASLVNGEGGVIVEQISELGVLQIELSSAKTLLRLKQLIEGSGYAKSVTFNVESTLN